MSIVRFIADLHFGHEAIARKRGFNNAHEHDEHLIKSWNSVVSKRDVTYILGDVTMESSLHYASLARLNGVKHVVLGNHDRRQDVSDLLRYVDSVSGMVKYKGHILTHCPIHPMEVGRFRSNIHGHIHDNVVVTGIFKRADNRYRCVSCERVDYKPVIL